MILAHNLNMNASYGAVAADLIGYSASIFISMYILNKKYKFNYNETIKALPKYILSWLIFIITILLLKLVIPTTLENRILQIPILCIFAIISFGIYIIINYKNGNLKKVFGNKIDKIFKKLKLIN